jgi:hypothetical protein
VQAAAACATVKVCPAIVAVPVRVVVAGLAATVRATVPLPVPLAPLATVIHDAPLEAVHPQPLPAVTETLADPPAAAGLVEPGVIAYEQARPDCETVKVSPATVNVPVRAAVDVLAATAYPTLALPTPDAPEVTDSQLAPLDAVHGHEAPTVSATEPVLAPAPTDVEPAASDGVQLPERANVFDGVLAVEPPGPIAVTRAS